MAVRTDWVYNGRPVMLADRADMPHFFRPGGRRAHHIQKVLDDTDPWKPGRDPIVTSTVTWRGQLPTALPIRRGATQIVWAVHRGHGEIEAEPGLSPFIVVDRSKHPKTLLVTIELAGSIEAPIVTRACVGDYTPPLPWMESAPDADEGGIDACIAYWRKHAFAVFNLDRITRGGSIQAEPPPWW